MQPDCVVSLVPDPAQDESISQILAGLIGESQYDQWFLRKTRFVIENEELLVYAASPFHQRWLQKQHREPLARAAQMLLGPDARLRFDVDTTLVAPEASAIALRGNAPPAASPGAALRSLPPAGSHDRQAPAALRRGRRFADLSDFVVGQCNAMAMTAVRQICQSPESAEGPLFIYGAVGMGKTHLLEGLYSAVRRNSPALQVVYLTAEQFTNHFTQGFRERAMPAFRNRFRTVDVLLVDDVEFLDAKRGVQEEFLHTWQQLESHGKLVVACGDRHPRLMTKISDELKTRFLSGMVCRLEPPDLETREQIAIGKARSLSGEFSPEALKYAARKFSNNVRELEGALHCLQVYYRMTGQRVGASAARQVLADLERDCLRVVRMADIERVVCDVFGLDSADLKSARRTRSVSEPRMLAMYLARRHTRAAYSEIGAFFGGRNHATVISADRKVGVWLAQNAQVKIASQTWRLVDVLSTIEQQLLAGQPCPNCQKSKRWCGVRAAVEGRRIVEFRRAPCPCRPIVLLPNFPAIKRRCEGELIVSVRRRAKKVVLELSSGDAFVIEPRMTGLVLLADPPDLEHLRLEWRLAVRNKQQSLWFWDQRGLGTVRLLSRERLADALGEKRLGPDALEMTPEEWKARCRATSRPIKVALLDQKLVAGIGNLYASEILHRAGIHPARRASRLKPVEFVRLAESVHAILEAAIRYEGSTLSDGTYRNALNQAGGYQNAHRVYDRRGESCLTCRRVEIRRIVQAQRSTYFCPGCQK